LGNAKKVFASDMTKALILDQIRRTAAENDGVPLGRDRFLTQTGIKEADWLGKYWVRWSDAIREAGYEPSWLMAQPITRRLKISRTATKYNQP